jgi:hypothetical protein
VLGWVGVVWPGVIAIFLQAIFNTEVMRYTLATGEPVLTGFMRTRPSCDSLAWLYAARGSGRDVAFLRLLRHLLAPQPMERLIPSLIWVIEVVRLPLEPRKR